MSQALYIQRGETIDYTPSSSVAAGAVVVQGDLIGVAVRPIPANTLGSLAVEGVFDFVKATGSGTAILAGSIVFWDSANNRASHTGTKLLGKAVMAASDSDARVRVRIVQFA